MALFQIDVEKLYAGEYWTNVYHVEAASLLDAVPMAAAIKEIERAVHKTSVTFTKARISDSSANPEFTTVVYNQAGLHVNATDVVPLWNTVRVDLQRFGGRPGRKYLRLPIHEDQTQGLNLTATMQTFIDTSYCNPMEGLGYVRTSTGAVVQSWFCSPAIQMRQLRRGSRRRTSPVI